MGRHAQEGSTEAEEERQGKGQEVIAVLIAMALSFLSLVISVWATERAIKTDNGAVGVYVAALFVMSCFFGAIAVKLAELHSHCS